MPPSREGLSSRPRVSPRALLPCGSSSSSSMCAPHRCGCGLLPEKRTVDGEEGRWGSWNPSLLPTRRRETARPPAKANPSRLGNTRPDRKQRGGKRFQLHTTGGPAPTFERSSFVVPSSPVSLRFEQDQRAVVKYITAPHCRQSFAERHAHTGRSTRSTDPTEALVVAPVLQRRRLGGHRRVRLRNRQGRLRP